MSDGAAQSPPPTAAYDHGSTLTRRRALQLGAGAIAATMLAGSVAGEEDEDDEDHVGDSLLDDPLFTDWRHGAAFAATGGFYFLARGVTSDLFWRDSTTAHGTLLWDQIYADALEMQFRRHTALNGLENNAEMFYQYLILDIADAIVAEAEKEESDQTDVEEAALEVVEDAVSGFEKQLYNLWVVDYLAALRRLMWAFEDDTGDIDFAGVFNVIQLNDDGSIDIEPFHDNAIGNQISQQYLPDYFDAVMDSGSDEEGYQSIGAYDWDEEMSRAPWLKPKLANGESVYVPAWVRTNSSQHVLLGPVSLTRESEWDKLDSAAASYGNSDDPDWLTHIHTVVNHEDPENLPYTDTYNAQVSITVAERLEDGDEPGEGAASLIDSRPFINTHRAIREAYDDAAAEVMTMTDLLYDDVKAGEITSDEIASGSAILEAAEEEDDWQAYATYYRALGMPEGLEYVTVEYAGMKLQGTMFLSNDGDSPLPVNEWTDPATLHGEAHMAFEVVEEIADSYEPAWYDDETEGEGDPITFDDRPGVGETGLMAFSSPFRILSTSEGSDELEFESRELIEDDYDPDDVVNALVSAYEAEQESREGSTEVDDGGSIGLPSIGNPLDGDGSALLGLGIIAAAFVAIVAFVTDLLPWTN